MGVHSGPEVWYLCVARTMTKPPNRRGACYKMEYLCGKDYYQMFTLGEMSIPLMGSVLKDWFNNVNDYNSSI